VTPNHRLAAGFSVGVSTVYRHVGEAIDLLATHAIPLHRAVYLAPDCCT
jgi:hypothetical protein